jgi:hypothetical protein
VEDERSSALFVVQDHVGRVGNRRGTPCRTDDFDRWTSRVLCESRHFSKVLDLQGPMGAAGFEPATSRV